MAIDPDLSSSWSGKRSMNNTARTANEYFAQLEDGRRDALLSLRKRIKEIWPTILEDMGSNMPTYHLNGHTLCALASQKHFMALYIMPYDLLNAFKKDLLIYDKGRSCIRFKLLGPATFDLFDRIIKYTGSQLEESQLVRPMIRSRVARTM